MLYNMVDKYIGTLYIVCSDYDGGILLTTTTYRVEYLGNITKILYYIGTLYHHSHYIQYIYMYLHT